MKRLSLAIACTCVLLSALLITPAAEAKRPTYVLLRPPAVQQTPKGHGPSYYYPGYGFGVGANKYSYGWFGVRSRGHWSRHFGYYRNYTEWSRQ